MTFKEEYQFENKNSFSTFDIHIAHPAYEAVEAARHILKDVLEESDENASDDWYEKNKNRTDIDNIKVAMSAYISAGNEIIKNRILTVMNAFLAERKDDVFSTINKHAEELRQKWGDNLSLLPRYAEPVTPENLSDKKNEYIAKAALMLVAQENLVEFNNKMNLARNNGQQPVVLQLGIWGKDKIYDFQEKKRRRKMLPQ